MTYHDLIRKHLRWIRAMLDKTHEEFSEMLGISRPTYTKLEKEHYPINQHWVITIFFYAVHLAETSKDPYIQNTLKVLFDVESLTIESFMKRLTQDSKTVIRIVEKE